MHYLFGWLASPRSPCRHADDASDGKLTIDFGLRARIEAIGNQFRPNIAPHDTALLLRTGIAAEYDAGPLIIGGEVIDSRAYFERNRSSVSTSEVNAIEPVQAYLKTDFSNRFSAQAGRFTMDLGSGRLVARSNFRNTVNGFTGARVDLSDSAGDGATLFWAMPQARLPDDTASIQDNDVKLDRERIGVQFFGAIVTRKDVLGAAFDGYLYRLIEDDAARSAMRNRHLWTVGAHLLQAPAIGRFDYEVEGAYQGGHARATTAATDIADLDAPPASRMPRSAASSPGRGARVSSSRRTMPPATAPAAITRASTPCSDRTPRSSGRAASIMHWPRPIWSASRPRAAVTPSTRWDGYVAIRPAWLASATDSFGGTSVRDATGDGAIMPAPS